MLHFEHSGATFCDGLSRRRLLSAGALAGGMLGSHMLAGGFSLANLLQRRAAAAETSDSLLPARAKACIQLFLWGGPGAQETWDLKPAAPDQARGEFKPIQTSVAGTFISEHLPLLAARADRYTIIRSLTHTGVNHGTSSYHMLTGHIHWSPGTLRHPARIDMPNVGINAARFLPHPKHLPGYVQLPAIINDGDGLPVPGQDAGILGDAQAPFRVLGDLTQPSFRVPELVLADGLSAERLSGRMGLRQRVAEGLEHLSRDVAGSALDSSYERAVRLLSSAETQRAFDLSCEAQALRQRYGYHHFAQGLVLARRLVEAGVPLVTVYWNSPGNADDQSWDTHNEQHRRLRDHLLPAFDRGVSALLDDLAERGLLDETLVAWFGEFGRTPRINSLGGRDHWGFCQSIGLAGGGIKPGTVYGSSNRDGGYPDRDPVSPDDLAATIFHCLGIDYRQHMFDLQGRPIPLSYGEPVVGVLA